MKAGWKTAFHRQTIAVGLAPATPDQYLLQRRRWGMGAMQILVTERLWAAKRWMSWRNYWEYLDGTLFWLEGVATVGAFCVPIAVMLTGAQTSTAAPLTFLTAFLAMFAARLWGAKRLLRGHIQWTTAFALRTLRIPVGLACAWWLVTRTSLEFVVTPKGGENERRLGGHFYLGYQIGVVPDDEDTRQPPRHLSRGRAMQVRVIPKRPGRMVSGNGELVVDRLAGWNSESHVVRIASRRNLETMEMQVGRLGQTIPKGYADFIARLRVDHGARDLSVERVKVAETPPHLNPVLPSFQGQIHSA